MPAGKRALAPKKSKRKDEGKDRSDYKHHTQRIDTNKRIDKEKINFLLQEIKRKKELQEISDEFVVKELLNYLRQDHKAQKFLSQLKPLNPKSAQYKTILKEVRAKLRIVYGLFREDRDLSRREELISDLLAKAPSLTSNLLSAKTVLDYQAIIEILKTHSSTKERAGLYEKLYQDIFAITGPPRTILDLGCGINPFSIPLMKLDSLRYYAYDLSVEEIEGLNDFFRLLSRINPEVIGKAEVLDILQFSRLPPADIAFLFKMTDVLEQGKGHKVTERILKLIPASFVVVSFPIKTMSGKKMNFPRRRWIELMCKRLGYAFNLIESENELFYVLKKPTE